MAEIYNFERHKSADDSDEAEYAAKRVLPSENLKAIYGEAERRGYFICPWQSDTDANYFAAVCDLNTVLPLINDVDIVPEIFKDKLVDCEIAHSESLDEAVGMAFIAWHQNKNHNEAGLKVKDKL